MDRENASHKCPGAAFFPQTFETRSRGPAVPSISPCALSTVAGEGEREVIAAPCRGVAGRAAGRKSTLQGQLVHCELVGVDQPPVPRGSREKAVLTDLPCGPTVRRTLRIPGGEAPGLTGCSEARPVRSASCMG